MSYYQILGFQKEPFSTSPDPDFFYLSKEHEAALTHILIELRLKRGLSAILGDIGTGKTSLSRRLIPELKKRDDFIFHIILDPSFPSEELFLSSLIRNFDIPTTLGYEPKNILEQREALEKFLFQKGVTEGKTVVLIIDEAQKLDKVSLETLRILLNYETNEYKLLQLVLLGQVELHSTILEIPNFLDRISFKYTLNPLGLDEMAELIDYRIRQAGYQSSMHLFLDEALDEIFRYTRGYPRKVTLLCHKALRNMVTQNRSVVNRSLIKDIVNEEANTGWASATVAVAR